MFHFNYTLKIHYILLNSCSWQKLLTGILVYDNMCSKDHLLAISNCKQLCSITNTLLYIKCSIRRPLIKRYISLEPLTFRFKLAILSISFYAPDGTRLNSSIYFILSSEINAYQKQIKVISFTSEMLYFHCSVSGLPLTFFHSLNAFHFRTSNANNFLICEQKHQVWVCIFLVRTWQIFWY